MKRKLIDYSEATEKELKILALKKGVSLMEYIRFVLEKHTADNKDKLGF